MKRAKIMLSALAVLAVVGSALAFKANKTFQGNLQCAATNTTTTICTLSTYTTTTPADGTIMACTALGQPVGVTCSPTTVRLFD